MMEGTSEVRTNRHDEYDTYIEWYENQINNREAPSIRYRRFDKMRHMDLAFEYGKYDETAPTIIITDVEIQKSVLDFRRMINEFRRNQDWGEYV